jgi:PAS domain-containing protein
LADVSKKTPFDNKVHGRVEATTDRMAAGHHMTGLSERSASVRHNRKDIENVLRGSEERFRLLVEGMKDYAIFMLDTEGRITSWNAGAQRINGYEAEEIMGDAKDAEVLDAAALAARVVPRARTGGLVAVRGDEAQCTVLK